MQDLIDTANFAPLRLVMTETSPVAHLLVELSLDELRLEATTADGEGFKVQCKSGVNWSYECIGEHESSGTADGNFITEGLLILIHYLKELGRDAEIGQFQMSLRLPKDGDTAQIQWQFMNRLLEYLDGRDPFLLKVGQYVMKYTGNEDITNKTGTYLEVIKLIGDKELVFTTCDSIRQPTRLGLDGVFRVSPFQKPKKLTVQGHFWTDVESDKWAEFRHITTQCNELTPDTIEDLIDKLVPSEMFKSCVITTLTKNPDIPAHFDSLPDYKRIESDDDVMKWEVQGVDVQFTFSIQGNKFTFERTKTLTPVIYLWARLWYTQHESLNCLYQVMIEVRDELMELSISVSNCGVQLLTLDAHRNGYHVTVKPGESSIRLLKNGRSSAFTPVTFVGGNVVPVLIESQLLLLHPRLLPRLEFYGAAKDHTEQQSTIASSTATKFVEVLERNKTRVKHFSIDVELISENIVRRLLHSVYGQIDEVVLRTSGRNSFNLSDPSDMFTNVSNVTIGPYNPSAPACSPEPSSISSASSNRSPSP